MEMYIKKNNKNMRRVGFRVWMASRKQAAIVRTVRSQVSNMIRGVTIGYKFKMVLAYAHFPIHVNILDDGKAI